MFVWINLFFLLRALRFSKKNFLLILLINVATSGHTQEVRNLYEEASDNFNHKNYYSALNLCREIILTCEKKPDPECWYTNIMKEVYRYKGLSEFEIFKNELKKKRLNDAIESLTISYGLFKDPEVQFLRGYLKSIYALLAKDITDLSGLVVAWESLLSLYARNGWQISTDIIDKIKIFIRVAEKFAQPIAKKNYTGTFAQFIIVMACDLAERGNLPDREKNYFEGIRLKYYRDDGNQWQKWRSNAITPN